MLLPDGHAVVDGGVDVVGSCVVVDGGVVVVGSCVVGDAAVVTWTSQFVPVKPETVMVQ